MLTSNCKKSTFMKEFTVLNYAYKLFVPISFFSPTLPLILYPSHILPHPSKHQPLPLLFFSFLFFSFLFFSLLFFSFLFFSFLFSSLSPTQSQDDTLYQVEDVNLLSDFEVLNMCEERGIFTEGGTWVSKATVEELILHLPSLGKFLIERIYYL